MREKPKTRKVLLDEETYLVIKDMQRAMKRSGVKRPSMCESLKVLLCHRQPGGWGVIVERARRRERERLEECKEC